MKLLSQFLTPSIRRRISSAFLMIFVLVLVMAVANYLQLRQVKPSSEMIIQSSLDLDNLRRLAAATAALDADLERYLVIRGPEYRESALNDLLVMADALELLQDALATDTQSEYDRLAEIITRLQASVQQIMKAQSANAPTGLTNRQIVIVYDDIETLKALLEDLSAQTLAGLQTTARDQSILARNVLNQSILLGISVVLVAMVTAFVTDRRLRTITNLTNTATVIADGDLERTASVESNDEIGKLAEAFNTMTGQLRELVASLEQRVADRTRAIKLSAEVGRRLSTILDSSRLVTEVVQLLQQAFHYYHVHIYLFDDAKQNLVMMGGTGEAGRIMLERGHKIPLGKGLVGRAAETGTAVLAADTSQEPDWLPNPLLPDTRAEIAVPILLGDTVLGVLDVQQNSVYGLGRDDMELLYGIAAQVAIALRNAEQYTQAQRRAQREALTSQIVQQIQSARSVESALQVSVRELGRALRMERTRVKISVNQDSNAEDNGNGKKSHE